MSLKPYFLRLESQPSKSFRCTLAANSLDIDQSKKLIHEVNLTMDVDSDFSVGLILGASGTGKSSLVRKLYGDCKITLLDPGKPVIDQLPEGLTYDECAELLSGIGLTSVPCWIRPLGTLSNGQLARARACVELSYAQNGEVVVLDEWTSTVDRTVAKVMSHCVQKFVRRNKKRIVLASCHYDVTEWLNPDWVVDLNTQSFTDRRRLLRRGEQPQRDKLSFEVREVHKSTWKAFSKYHYLTDRLSGGKAFYFGLFHNGDQIGFCTLNNYVPHVDKARQMIMHFGRCVVLPDYQGLGLGVLFVERICSYGRALGFRTLGKFSSIPMYKSLRSREGWTLLRTDTVIGRTKGGAIDRIKYQNSSGNAGGLRQNVKTWTFEYAHN